MASTPTYTRCPLCRAGFFDWGGGDVGVTLARHFRIDSQHRKAVGAR